MRVSVLVAVLSLIVVGVVSADPAVAVIRKPTNIPPEPLDLALRTLAKERQFQVLFRAEVVRDVRTGGAIGEFTPDEALRHLLVGTGLSYKYLDASTVTVFSVSSARAEPTPPRPLTSKEVGKRTSQGFRMARVDQGQNPQPATVSNGGSSQSNLQEVVVTAQKRSERLQNVPISISVVSGRDLDRSNFSGVTEVLNTVPGVVATVSPQGGGTQLTVRGVSAPYALFSGSSPIAYYVDSVPFGLVRSAVAPDENIYDLRRIEVLRGPQGTLYGASALNGVVRVLTNDPDLNEFDFKARASTSTTDMGGQNYGGDMAANVPIVAGKLAARVVAGDAHESGWLDSATETHANYSDSSNMRLKVSALPLDALEVGLSAWHSQASFGAPSNADQTGRLAAVHPEPIVTTTNAYALKVNYDLPAFSISSVSSYLLYDNRSVIDLNPVINADITIPQSLKSRVASEELNLVSKADGPWRWSAGAFYRNAKDSTLQTLLFYPSMTSLIDSDFSDSSKSAAVYGELGRRFLDGKLELSAGLRYFHDDSSTQANAPLPGQNISLEPVKAVSEATTPRAILTWHPASHMMVYASYGQGFRSGFPQDELVPRTFSPVKPDKLSNYEVGTKGSVWEGRLSYEAAAYYIHWEGVQQEIGIPAANSAPIGVTVNGQSASGPGVDFSVSTQPLQDLDLGLNVSWNHLTFDSAVYSAGALLFAKGARLGASPEYTAGGSARYSFPFGSSGLRGQLGASVNYTSEMNSTVYGFGSYVGQSVLIARGDFTLEWPDHWRAQLFVDNLSNERRTPLIVLPVWREQMRPRTIGAQLEYSFR